MKTNHIALSLLAGVALLLSACVNEESFEQGGVSFEKDEVVFKIGSVQTRSAAENQPMVNELGSITTEDGSTFVLQETVTSLDDVSNAPETRGTPAFTENVKDLYGTFYTVAMNANTGAAVFAKNQDLVNGVEYTYEKDNEQGKGIWHYRYGEDIWEGKLPTYFFMRMPGKNDNVTLGDNPYSLTDGSISFSYTSLNAAADQKDILFTSYKRTEKTNAEEITFYHALTGVKFSNYFTNEAAGEGKKTTKTIIKSVTISGIKNSGTCVVTPSAGTSADASVWTVGDTRTSFTITAGEAPNDTTNYKGGSYKLDELLDENATARNINDKNGSMTLWLIPQDLTKTATDSVTLTVVFDVTLDGKKTFENKEVTACLSTKLLEGHRVWKAGQLHTFTLKPTAVGVDIDDKLTDYVKSDVVVENTGNVYEYVRVNMIGNWMGLVCSSSSSAAEDATLTYPEDKKENYVILMGYPSNTKNEDGEYVDQKLVNPWNDKDFYSNNTYRAVDANDIFMSPYKAYGQFENLPCMADEPAEGQEVGPGGQVGNWIRHDKYYYYMLPIGPGDSVTEDLFKSYTIGKSPAFWIADKFGTRRPAINVHFEMDLAVQAIEAPMNADGVTPAKTYLEAWTDVLNPKGDEDFNINDL